MIFKNITCCSIAINTTENRSAIGTTGAKKNPNSHRRIPLLIFCWFLCSLSLINAQSKDELRQEIARLRNDSLVQNKLWKTQILKLTETISDQKRSLSQLQEYANGLQVSVYNLKADSTELSKYVENYKKMIFKNEERCNQQKSELLISLDSVRNELSTQSAFPFFDTSSQNYIGKK
ncbi:MAG: hypothetical protein O3C22_08235 [Bacteroidetes bacterium]|nr:hypothetical protein [Bacteroidota bacterium]MDA0944367.1 hypothetical protein [Bacteroidota bacterium]MDA1112558.1 hypothetical protein [Bacteroidota bacterium]